MPKKILAVDDERHIVRLIQVNLERAGYEVVTAYDGQEALGKVDTEKPDLVVLDLMMPYMHGFEVLEILRKNPATRELPVIMLTSKAPDQDVFRGWQSGVDCYLSKPFNPMELVSFVKRIFSLLDVSDATGNEGDTAPPTPSPVSPVQPTASAAAAQPAASARPVAPPATPVASAQPVSLWKKVEQVWRKIGF